MLILKILRIVVVAVFVAFAYLSYVLEFSYTDCTNQIFIGLSIVFFMLTYIIRKKC